MNASRALGDLLARIEAIAAGVARRVRAAGIAVLVAAVAAWCLVLRAFVFDSWGAALAWSPVLLLLLIPGIVLAGFARRAARLAGLPEATGCV